MKYTKFLWNMNCPINYIYKYDKTIGKDLAGFIVIPILIMLIALIGSMLCLALIIDITRTLRTLAIKIFRKYFPVVTHYYKCPCCDSEELLQSTYLANKHCANCNIYFEEFKNYVIIHFNFFHEQKI